MNERTFYSTEAKERAMRERGIIIVVMLSLGLGIGAGLALLFAPKEGESLRGEIIDALEHRFNDMDKQITQLRDQVEDRITSR